MAGDPVVIVGAGVGGLSVGCYLRMAGHDTLILEMGRSAGGVCVSWKRGEYVFDGATNWLPGAKPACNLHGLLAELVDFSRLPIHHSDVFIRVERDGDCLNVYKDAHRLRQEMLGLAPGDSAPVGRFIDAILAASRLDVPWSRPAELMTAGEKLAFVVRNRRLLLLRQSWRGVTIGEYATRFASPVLRRLFLGIFPHHEFFSMLALVMTLGWMHGGGEGYPMGGSARFTSLLEERYRMLGGAIEFGKRAVSIDVDRDRAQGVTCADGSSYQASAVVSAADGHETLFDLLGGRWTDRRTRRRYDSWPVFPAIVQVGVGVARAFTESENKVSCPLPRPLRLGSVTAEDMMVRIMNFDPSMAPPGGTSLVVHLRTPDYRSWVDLRSRDRDLYRAEKERVASAVIEALEARFGDVAGKVEEVDVATPATYIRLTRNWKGAYQSWAPTPAAVGALLPRTLPGLDRFYMTGHWLWPGGGLPAVFRISRDVAHLVHGGPARGRRSFPLPFRSRDGEGRST